jgi:hypothetical protein
MKAFGILLIVLFFVIGIASEHLPKECDPRPFVGIAFLYFIIGITFLMISKKIKDESTRS